MLTLFHSILTYPRLWKPKFPSLDMNMDTNTDIDKIIKETVDKIVETAHPLKVILFGSAVRGEMGPNSDIDLLVIMPDGIHRRKTAFRLYRAIADQGFAADLIVVTDKDVRKHRNDPAYIVKNALDEGRELYAA